MMDGPRSFSCPPPLLTTEGAQRGLGPTPAQAAFPRALGPLDKGQGPESPHLPGGRRPGPGCRATTAPLLLSDPQVSPQLLSLEPTFSPVGGADGTKDPTETVQRPRGLAAPEGPKTKN